MRTSSLLFILIGLCSCNDEGKRSFDEGARALARGDWSMCIEENTNAIRHNRKSWEAYVNRAICRLESGDAAGAVDDASTAIQLSDTIEGNYLVRAGAFQALGKMADAEADLRQARKLAPRSPSVLMCWAQHHLILKQYSLALSDLDSALILDPGNRLAVAMKGSVLVQIKRYEDAVGLLLPHSRESSDQLLTNLINLGFAESQLGLFEDAERDLESAMKLDSMNGIVWNNLGYVHFRLGDVEKGKRMIDRAIQLDPSNAYAYYNRGLIALDIDDIVNACVHFHKAASLGFTRDHGPEVDSLIHRYCEGPRLVPGG